MPSSPAEKTHYLTDFGALLRILNDQGFPYIVIGGCAVGAYANVNRRSTP